MDGHLFILMDQYNITEKKQNAYVEILIFRKEKWQFLKSVRIPLEKKQRALYLTVQRKEKPRFLLCADTEDGYSFYFVEIPNF